MSTLEFAHTKSSIQMNRLLKSVLIGIAFVATYFAFIVVVFRIVFALGYDPRIFEFLQWPITFPLALPTNALWDYLGRRGYQKSLSITAAYLLIDVIIYSAIAYGILWLRSRRNGVQ
ncbi:MAG TPA: hypothetical protein VJ781_07875 [Pyrinomonadaceae bacterium]|nr:hypothetical protein [Pyrinomonadaceae bacterium]